MNLFERFAPSQPNRELRTAQLSERNRFLHRTLHRGIFLCCKPAFQDWQFRNVTLHSQLTNGHQTILWIGCGKLRKIRYRLHRAANSAVRFSGLCIGRHQPHRHSGSIFKRLLIIHTDRRLFLRRVRISSKGHRDVFFIGTRNQKDSAFLPLSQQRLGFGISQHGE